MEMAAEDETFRPSVLEDMPELFPGLEPMLEAFLVLSGGREWGEMSGMPQRLKLSEIYCHLTEIAVTDYEDRREWVYLIQVTDQAWCDEVARKRQK